jgi:hypothetical protein
MSFLNKKLGETITANTKLAPLAEDGDLSMEQEGVLDNHWVKKKGLKWLKKA